MVGKFQYMSGLAALKSGSPSLEELRPEADLGLKPSICAPLYTFPARCRISHLDFRN
jgi:hypothetical protein